MIPFNHNPFYESFGRWEKASCLTMSINESLPLDHAQHLCMHTRTWIPMPRIERERPTRLNNVLSIWQEDELHRRLILELTFLSVRINFDRRCRFFPFASTKSSTA